MIRSVILGAGSLLISAPLSPVQRTHRYNPHNFLNSRKHIQQKKSNFRQKVSQDSSIPGKGATLS